MKPTYEDLKSQLTALTSQLESVVAECSGLRHLLYKIGETGNANFGRTSLPTPATSAFLAEVRASGVEMFVKELKSAIAVDSNGSTRSRALTRIVERTSAHLRKGVQS